MRVEESLREDEGHIGVETELGRGTAFRVHLPTCGQSDRHRDCGEKDLRHG
jgi:hypothetical protein